MGPIDPPCTPPPPPGDLLYCVPGTCPNMKSGCHHHQIGMDYLWDANFKMAVVKISGITFSPIIFAYNSVSWIDRDKIFVSNPMFMWMNNPYDPWLTRNSKWLPSKPAEITLSSQWAQFYCTQCIK